MRDKRNRREQRGLDLHGIKHQDVPNVVEDFILINEPPYKIITGHSSTMKNITRSILNKHGFKYTDDAFGNLGCILVMS